MSDHVFSGKLVCEESETPIDMILAFDIMYRQII